MNLEEHWSSAWCQDTQVNVLGLLILRLLGDAESISQMAGMSHSLFELRVTFLVVSMSLFLWMLVLESRY